MNQNPELMQHVQLRSAKFARRKQLESAWEQRLLQGISIGEIKLRCHDVDRSAFSQLLVMLAEAERMDQLPASVPVTDRGGQIHMLSVPNLRNLLLAYGSAYQSLWVQKAQFHAAIEQAETLEALNQISINLP